MGPAGVDPQVGSTVKWDMGHEVRDLGQMVPESEPYRRLSYSWHNYQWEWHEMFGWTEEQFAQLGLVRARGNGREGGVGLVRNARRELRERRR